MGLFDWFFSVDHEDSGVARLTGRDDRANKKKIRMSSADYKIGYQGSLWTMPDSKNPFGVLACTGFGPFHITTNKILVIMLGIFFKMVSIMLIPNKFQIQENISYWFRPNQQSCIIVLLCHNSVEFQYLLFEATFTEDIERVTHGKFPASCIYNTTNTSVKRLESYTDCFNIDVVYRTKVARVSLGPVSSMRCQFVVSGSRFAPRVFRRVLRLFSFLKNQHLQIPIRPG